jgi:membrane protein implicated in regulation of membrane protease activity
MISDLFGGAHPSILWAVLAIILAIAEMFLPGVFLIWLSVAAALTAGATLLLPISEPFQLFAFAIFSALSVSGGRLWYLARPVEGQDPLLNDRAARMIGRQVVVAEAITHGEGRVRIDDGSWPATGPDAEIGAHMLITGINGSTLVVTHLPDGPG